jgi:hypothetical protein
VTLARSAPMRRSAIKAKAPVREPRPDRSAEFANFEVRATTPAVMARVTVAAEPVLKVQQPHDQRIRDSAKGEDCTVRIVGACTHNPEHTIWSHAPLQAAGKGRGWKSIDLAGAYCCTACDAVIDGQRPLPPGATRDSVMLDWFMGHMRSLVILKQKGLA